jgi:probable HAF family extracellular repeat protein
MSRFVPLLCLALLASPSYAQTYTIVDLGTLGGPASQAHGLNAKGWVVGESITASGQDHAFVYHDGQMIDLGVSGAISTARSVNDAGQVGGSYYGKNYEAFLAAEDRLSNLGTLGQAYSVTFAINAQGHAAGGSYTKDAREHAFFWDGRTMTDLGTLGGTYSTALGMNSRDEVVGFAYLPNQRYHAFAGTTAGLTDLGTLGGDYSSAYAVNDAGQVAGYSFLQGDEMHHACLWVAGVAHDLGSLNGNQSEALALDGTASRVVGRALVPAAKGYASYHAFLWSDGAMRDLNELIAPGSGWVLEEASGVNDAGQIVGSGSHLGQHRAFLLQPNAPATAQRQLPTALALAGPAPNPTRESARFSYALPRAGQVSIRVIDVSGRLVRDLAHEWQPAGTHDLTWNLVDDGGRRVGSGVYFGRLQLDREIKTTTVEVLR